MNGSVMTLGDMLGRVGGGVRRDRCVCVVSPGEVRWW